MEIQRAINLGMLHQQLGIDRDARISLKITPERVEIWDLETETMHVIKGNQRDVHKQPVPEEIKRIIKSSDEDLKGRYSESWEDGWSEEGAALFTKLTYRGISVLGLS